MPATVSSSARTNQLKGGLLAPAPRHMPTLFTLIIFWWAAWMLALVFLPFLAHAHQDSWWSLPTTVALMSSIIVVSTGHGALGYIMGCRTGGKVINFVLGGLLGPIGLIIVHLMTKDKPDQFPEPSKGIMKTLDRLAFALGNLWFGIAQIFLMICFLIRATIYETEFASQGNDAAYASYYNSPIFGLIFLLFFMTIYAATMRKYPFRWSQSGWLVTHLGLLTMMVGCMIMYWGGFNGFVMVLEGHTTSSAYNEKVNDLDIEIPSLGYHELHRVSVDYDPEQENVAQEIPIKIEHNGSSYDLNIKIDRFLSRAENFTELVPLEKNQISPSRGQAGVRFKLSQGEKSREDILLENTRNGSMPLGMYQFQVRTYPRQHILDSFGHRYAADDLKRGRLLVRKDGKVIGETPVILASAETAGSAGRMIKGGTIKLPNGGPTITVERYYATLGYDNSQMAMDSDPRTAVNPAVLVSIDGAKGREEVHVPTAIPTVTPQPNAYGLEVEYICTAELALKPGSAIFGLGPNEKWSLTLTGNEGTQQFPLEIGQSYHLLGIDVTPLQVLARATSGKSCRKSDSSNPFAALHATVTLDGESRKMWLAKSERARTRLANHEIGIQYLPRKVPLGFEISCLDFRHENYPNDSRKAKTYESNMVLRDPRNGVEETVLVDMNHPLSYAGYQFFNGSPVTNEASHVRGIQLTVGRNPGYGTIIFAGILLFIGFIMVFFFKKRIRDWDINRRKKQSA